MSILNTSVFNLKIKSDQEKIVKESKIEKIMHSLFKEEDHGSALKKNLRKLYSDAYDYRKFLTNPEEFREILHSKNLKIDITQDNHWETVKNILTIQPGDLLPSEKELPVLVLEVLSRVQTPLTRSQRDNVGRVIAKAYQNLNDRFPKKEDVIKEFKDADYPAKFLEELSVYEFVFGEMLKPQSSVYEAEAERAWLETMAKLKERGRTRIYESDLLNMVRHEKIKSYLMDLLDASSGAKSLYQAKGDIELLEIFPRQTLAEKNKEFEVKTMAIKNNILQSLISGQVHRVSSGFLRRNGNGIDVIRTFPEMIKQLKKLVKFEVVIKKDSADNLFFKSNDYTIEFYPQIMIDEESELLKQISSIE